MNKNITLSADEKLIDLARKRAANENHSLNDAFRQWLAQWTGFVDPVTQYDKMMCRLDEINSGRKFSRDEMNA